MCRAAKSNIAIYFKSSVPKEFKTIQNIESTLVKFNDETNPDEPCDIDCYDVDECDTSVEFELYANGRVHLERQLNILNEYLEVNCEIEEMTEDSWEQID